MKQQPQSLYWTQDTVTIHSGISKSKNGKSYHPYVSDCKTHDQVFVDLVMKEMLDEEDLTSPECIVVDSDNCTAQYKSAVHFYNLQQISNTYDLPVIRIYGVPGHGKGEVDHVGGMAKVAVHRMAAEGHTFQNAEDITSALHEKFNLYTSPQYHIKEIKVQSQNKIKKMNFKTVEGSSNFRVILFKPSSITFKAANKLCICDDCRIEYGSCENFDEYELIYSDAITKILRSDYLTYQNNDQNNMEDESNAWDFIDINSVVAVAADEKSTDSVWFIKISENACIGDNSCCLFSEQFAC